MNIVKVNNKKYKYPAAWDEMTISQFDGMREALERVKKGGIKQMVAVYSVVSGIPESVFYDAPKQFYKEIENTLLWLNTPPDHAPELSQIINGTKYAFPPTLNDISLGEFADLDEVLKMDNMVNAGILAVLFRPEGEKYDAARFFERRQFWSKQPAGRLIPIINFFFQTENDLQAITKTFSETAAAVLQELIRAEILVKSGGGSIRPRSWRGVIYLKLIRYYKKILLRFLISSPIA